MAGGFFCLLLSACNPHLQSGLRTYAPIWDSTQRDMTRNARLQPDYEYLRVEINGYIGLMVKGGEAATPRGTVVSWYSADGAVVKTVNGRLVSYADPLRRWEQISTAPGWNGIQEITFRETWDAQPGDRFGITRWRVRRNLDSAPKHSDWKGPAEAVIWTEEVDRYHDAASFPAAHYAVRRTAPHETVYGERCVAPDWCLRWQHWPPQTDSVPAPSRQASATTP